MRLAYARIMQESNAFSPVPTTLADFERTHFVSGAELTRRVASRWVHEVPGFVRNAELSGLHDAIREARDVHIEPVPILSAWAISGGPLSRDCAATLEARLAEGLRRAGPVDGVFLALHGAMSAEGEADIEARLLETVRAIVGPVPIACTFDLHGLLTRRKMQQVDLLAAYNTNPHRDHRATGARAGRMLIRALRGHKTARAWRSLPMITGGGAGVDFLAPSSKLFRLMRSLGKTPGVQDLSLFLCHPWNADRELGWSTAAFADDQRTADRIADQLAEAAWQVRDAAPPRFIEVDEALARVRHEKLRRKLGTICWCDASDVVGAGGSGENTRLLAALLAAPDLRSHVPLRDADAVDALWSRDIGDTVELAVGGRFDPIDSPPVSVRGVLRHKRTTGSFGRIVALDLGHVQLVLTEAAPLVMKPAFYRQVGLEPLRADITVVKSFFPFRLYFLAESRLALYVKTRGVTDLDRVQSLTMNGPVHPMTRLADWRAQDARRRAEPIREAIGTGDRHR